MQEEVENRTLTLVVSGTKFTGRLLKAAISKYLAHRKEKKLQKLYSQNSIYNNLVQWYERPWGFYVSPELGMDIHPVPYQRLGFHVAVYYSYATNKTDILTYSEDGRNSMGVRVGVCF